MPGDYKAVLGDDFAGMVVAPVRRRLIAGTINWYEPEEGWENVHLDVSPRDIWKPEVGPVPVDVVADISRTIPLEAGSFDEVRAHHVLEHLWYEQAREALVNLWQLLKPDGILDVEVPDLDRIIAALQAGNLSWEDAQQWLYGEQLLNHEAGDSHRCCWTEQKLVVALIRAGFRPGKRLGTGLGLRIRTMKR